MRSQIEGSAFQPEGLYELIEASPLVDIIADGSGAHQPQRRRDLVTPDLAAAEHELPSSPTISRHAASRFCAC